ncbi:MAG: hypothetical protein ACRDN1_25290 [Trebonia sp.]
MTADDVDPFALLTAKEAAGYAKVSVQAIWNWYKRGHLRAATDEQGNEILDSRGKRQYRLVDVARADAKMAATRERMALRILAPQAAA